jgi:hypothetical protein
MALSELMAWTPFRLDALGLVTILGTNELDRTIGSLVRNRFTEFLPLLAAFLIAGNTITEPVPGFTVYNITDGIVAGDLAGWLARWLLCQEFTWNSTVLHVEVTHTRPRRLLEKCGSVLLGGIVVSAMTVISILMTDWFGLANALSMLVSVLVRYIVVKKNRDAIDQGAVAGFHSSSDTVKMFLTLPNGKAISIYAPRGVVVQSFLTTPRPSNPRWYAFVRSIGWVAFGCHIITLGMAALVNQIISVCVLVGATVVTVWRIGAVNDQIAYHLDFNRVDAEDPEDSRTGAYLRLKLTATEERMMVAWNLLPHESNKKWWQTYRFAQGETSLKMQTENTRPTVSEQIPRDVPHQVSQVQAPQGIQ